ncbi:MAG: helix-turn-helix transcriptional regulator [Actinobacteria bacterium]|nr:helix-turn-helix transcriptional regulator [Actinomycetota bacterium]
MASLRPPSVRFAANLRRLRTNAGLSQEELAFRAAIHRTQISLLEGGGRMPRVLTLVCLAGALGVTPDDLLDGITWEPIVSVSGGLVVNLPGGGDDAEG